MTLLIVASLAYPNYPSVPLLLVHSLFLFLLFLLGMVFFYDKQQLKTQLRQDRHLTAMRLMLRRNIPAIHTVDYSCEAVIILDNSGVIIESNAQSSLLLSLGESCLTGQPISKFIGILHNYDPTHSPQSGEFKWETPEKIVKYIKFRRRPLLDDDIPSGMLLTLFDISELKRSLETNVEVAKFAIINEISAGLAHEIRNPLTTIKGFMQLITPEQWPESFRPYQQIILDEIQCIDKVLSKFVMSTSPSAPQMQQLNLIETIEATLQLIKPFELRQDITLNLDFPSPSVYVMGDHEQLLQALLSLLNNAIEASPKGGNVIIRLTEYESHARISVIDDGPGIPKSLHQRVLDPFFTTQEDGTGLGLTIAQQIILAHHGKLHFSESIPPGGTEAMIDLPSLSKFTNSLSA
ncbi:two-component system sensor histidine kinase NtrB [Desulfosporosinus fructosivorans]|nr:ATP-binding protein [Desulfosporosinus fructosivorans]